MQTPVCPRSDLLLGGDAPVQQSPAPLQQQVAHERFQQQQHVGAPSVCSRRPFQQIQPTSQSPAGALFSGLSGCTISNFTLNIYQENSSANVEPDGFENFEDFDELVKDLDL